MDMLRINCIAIAKRIYVIDIILRFHKMPNERYVRVKFFKDIPQDI